MKFKELQNRSQSELKNILEENREKLRQLRFDLASGKVKNVREIRKTKEDIARISTLIKTK